MSTIGPGLPERAGKAFLTLLILCLLLLALFSLPPVLEGLFIISGRASQVINGIFHIDSSPPSYSHANQSADTIIQGSTIILSAYWLDNIQLDYAWLSTNESGAWENRGLINIASPSGWSNFTWSSPGFYGTAFWRISANDTTGNINSTPVMSFNVSKASAPPLTGGGDVEWGGGGGGAQPMASLTLDKEFIKAVLNQGETVLDYLNITNAGETRINISARVEGLERHVTLGESSFTLEPGESKSVTVSFAAGRDTEPDVYSGRILLNADNNFTRAVSLIMEVRPEESLFDIHVSLPQTPFRVRPGGEIQADILVYNLGDEPRDMALYYSLREFTGKDIVHASETVKVAGQTLLRRVITVPREIEYGFYLFYARMEYGNHTAASSSLVEVAREEPQAKEAESYLSYLLLAAILIALIASLAVIALWTHARSRVPSAIPRKAKEETGISRELERARKEEALERARQRKEEEERRRKEKETLEREQQRKEDDLRRELKEKERLEKIQEHQRKEALEKATQKRRELEKSQELWKKEVAERIRKEQEVLEKAQRELERAEKERAARESVQNALKAQPAGTASKEAIQKKAPQQKQAQNIIPGPARQAKKEQEVKPEREMEIGPQPPAAAASMPPALERPEEKRAEKERESEEEIGIKIEYEQPRSIFKYMISHGRREKKAPSGRDILKTKIPQVSPPVWMRRQVEYLRSEAENFDSRLAILEERGMNVHAARKEFDGMRRLLRQGMAMSEKDINEARSRAAHINESIEALEKEAEERPLPVKMRKRLEAPAPPETVPASAEEIEALTRDAIALKRELEPLRERISIVPLEVEFTQIENALYLRKDMTRDEVEQMASQLSRIKSGVEQIKVSIACNWIHAELARLEEALKALRDAGEDTGKQEKAISDIRTLLLKELTLKDTESLNKMVEKVKADIQKKAKGVGRNERG